MADVTVNNCGNPCISVIIPVYNANEYLRSCVDSVLEQSFADFELILVDDGSTDGSGIICDYYGLRDQRVKVIHQENQGVSCARNVGLNRAQAEYITFVDSDDLVDKEFLKFSLARCKEYGLDMYITGYVIVPIEAGSTSPKHGAMKASISNRMLVTGRQLSCEEKFFLLEKEYTSVPWGKLYRRSFLAGNTFDESMHFGEDLKFVYELLNRPCRLMADPELFYIYQKHVCGLSGRIDFPKVVGMKKTYLLLLEDCRNTPTPGKERYAELINQRLQNDYSSTIKQILQSTYSGGEKYKLLKMLLKDKSIEKALMTADKKAVPNSYRPFHILIQYYKKKFGRKLLKNKNVNCNSKLQ